MVYGGRVVLDADKTISILTNAHIEEDHMHGNSFTRIRYFDLSQILWRESFFFSPPQIIFHFFK